MMLLPSTCGYVQRFDWLTATIHPEVLPALPLAFQRGVAKRFDLAPALLVERHFFTPAAQLTHIVSGAFGSVSTTALIRKRCPSAVTA